MAHSRTSQINTAQILFASSSSLGSPRSVSLTAPTKVFKILPLPLPPTTTTTTANVVRDRLFSNPPSPQSPPTTATARADAGQAPPSRRISVSRPPFYFRSASFFFWLRSRRFCLFVACSPAPPLRAVSLPQPLRLVPKDGPGHGPELRPRDARPRRRHQEAGRARAEAGTHSLAALRALSLRTLLLSDASACLLFVVFATLAAHLSTPRRRYR